MPNFIRRKLPVYDPASDPMPVDINSYPTPLEFDVEVGKTQTENWEIVFVPFPTEHAHTYRMMKRLKGISFGYGG